MAGPHQQFTFMRSVGLLESTDTVYRIGFDLLLARFSGLILGYRLQFSVACLVLERGDSKESSSIAVPDPETIVARVIRDAQVHSSRISLMCSHIEEPSRSTHLGSSAAFFHTSIAASAIVG